jgi:hypothetical protein
MRAVTAGVTLAMATSMATGDILTVGIGAGYGYSRIGDAMAAAKDGDTVLVDDGVYSGDGNRDLSFGGKAITVRSANGPEKCIVDCGGSASEHHQGFVFDWQETDAVLSGFTIRNGYESEGGAIFMRSCSPTVTDNIIENNTAYRSGGGVYLNFAMRFSNGISSATTPSSAIRTTPLTRPWAGAAFSRTAAIPSFATARSPATRRPGWAGESTSCTVTRR